MIIDLILNRKDGSKYNAKELYNYAINCQDVVGANRIANALDNGDEQDVKNALCSYIVKNDYSLKICDYILKNNWL